MALNTQDIDILEQIVKVEGKCMESTRCSKCPFRSLCLPEFLNVIPPTTNQRQQMALDVLTHHSLMGDDVEVKDYKWDRK